MARTDTEAANGKSRRISVDLGTAVLEQRFLKAKKKVGIKTNGGFGQAAFEWAICMIEAGKLIAVNGKLVPAHQEVGA